MSKRKIFFSLSILIFFAGLFLVCIFWFDNYQKTTEVVFLSVGEGDAMLISQGSNQILIDGGRASKDLLARLGRHMPFWDRTVEIVVATHPDADHIGGFAGLLTAYHVGQFLYTGAESKTEEYMLLRQALETDQTNIQKVFRGSTVRLPKGGNLIVEYPLTTLPEDMAETNTGSIVTRFTFGETKMLFTGDLPNEEGVLPNIGAIDILKVAHHGSRYSTSAAFLEQLQPKEAIISVGKNMYGHPSPDVLKRLEEKGVKVHRTDREGDIVYRCTKVLATCVFVQ
jgi:competence protein ComEC